MTSERNIRIALAGCGTVGGGVCEIVTRSSVELAQRTGLRFEVVRALVRDKSKPREFIDPKVLTTDFTELAGCNPDVVVEVMGGTTMAKDVVLTALRSGIPVVTANKALLAEHGAEVYRTAREHHTCIVFEASCAGGLPIIGALLHGFLGNRISRILGIFNSTCNFVLTQMLDVGLDFESAVKQAQLAGYAEEDPSLDINGGDTAHKLAILASLAFGENITLERINTTGIDGLSVSDLTIARELGFSCKLLGVGVRHSDGIEVDVRPTLVRACHPLAALSGTCSGVVVDGNVVGRTLFAGAGAGSLPTASAVVADLIDVASGAAQQTFDTARMFNDQTATPNYIHPNEVESPFYLRFDATRLSLEEISADLTTAAIGIERCEHIPAHQAVAVITLPVALAKVRDAALQVAKNTETPVILHILTDESV